jgi:hypothetical protein
LVDLGWEVVMPIVEHDEPRSETMSWRPLPYLAPGEVERRSDITAVWSETTGDDEGQAGAGKE